MRKSMIALARFLAGLWGYDVVFVHSTAIGPDGRKAIALQFQDGKGVAGEVSTEYNVAFQQMASDVSGEGSLSANTLRLAEGMPL